MSNKNKLPDLLTKEQLIKLFENMLIPKCSIACFMALMCGLRVKEICRLQIADIDLQRRQIKIRDSKNPNRTKQGYGKDRIVPIPEIAISPIKKWLEIIDGGKWFIPSEKSPDNPLRTKTLHIWFSEARTRANLDIPEYKVKYKRKTHPNNSSKRWDAPVENKESSEQYTITQENIEMVEFYDEFLYQKTDDFYDAQDSGEDYFYKGIKIKDYGHLEELVEKDIVEMYQIPVAELKRIYILVSVYKNQ